jgi:hypothetical protein
MPDHITLVFVGMLLPKKAVLPRHSQDSMQLRFQETHLQDMNLVTSTIGTLKAVLLHAGSWDIDGKPDCGL